jgi:hypothetical protein
MSRAIPFDRPLTPEDRDYLHMRGEHARVAQLDEQFPPLDSEEDEEMPAYSTWKLAELQAEIARVNAEFDAGLEPSGTKAELADRLAVWWNTPEADEQPPA